MSLMLWKTLGAYRIESELGSGGMGTVYLAACAEDVLDLHAGDRVALKVIHPHLLTHRGFFKRFMREGEVGKAVRHPNVVRTYDVDALTVEGEQQNFLVMEYVEGQTLRALLDELERVPEELCRHIGREVAKGLAAIHEAGVVHRDLKPENVLITPDHVVKIMDLGVARLADEAIRLSQTGAFVGSPHYAAPEQFKRGGEDLDGRADLHALGLILYELSSGEHPYLADDIAEVLEKVLSDEPRRLAVLNPQLSPFFEEVVHTLLAKDRVKRFDSAAELLSIMEAGERSTWWNRRAVAIRAETKRPLRRIRIPRETEVYGRENELAKLRALYEKAKAGDGQVVLIEGEAGIGKTRLVDELVGRLQQDSEDLSFLFGSYPPGGAATAAGAWSTAYREHFGAEGLEETLADYLTVTPILIPAFAALLRGEPPPEGKEALTKDSIQTVFVHATRALAAERPTVVLIEDLHFAPEEGRAMLAALALSVPGHEILLVGTTRPGLPRKWTANLERLEHAAHLDLDRLGPKDLANLLIDAFHSERLADELGFQIVLKSDGNPFFVFEIIRGLREGQFITRKPDGTWVSTQVIRDIEIPSSVQDLIQARISDLDEEEQELLDVAACCGFEFDGGLVAEAAGVRKIPALRLLGHLEKSHRVVRATGRTFVFDHHQVQEALYSGISEQLREEYHAAIGEVLLSRHPEPDGPTAVELCEHFLDGARGEKAVGHLDAALDHLEAGYLNDQAVALADRALSVEGLLTGSPRAEVLLKKGTRLELLGRRELEEATLEEAVALAEEEGDPGLRSSALLAVGHCHTLQSRYEEARAELRISRELAREIGDREGEVRATGNLGNVFWSLGRFEEAREHYEQALAIARQIGDRRSEARATGNLGGVFWNLGLYEGAREHYERSLAIAREIGDRRGEAGTTGSLGGVLNSLGRYEEGREHHERYLAIAREIGDRRGEGYAMGYLGAVFYSLGRYGEALEHYERWLAIDREIGDRPGEASALVNLGPLHAWLGDLEKAKERLDRSLAIALAIGDRRGEGYALHGLAEVAEATGDGDRAKRLCEESLALHREIDFRSGIAGALTTLSRILLAEDRLDEAKVHLEEALALGRDLEVSGTVVLASALLALPPGADLAHAARTFEEHEPSLRHAEKLVVRFLLFRATNEAAHLEEAHRLLGHLRDHAPEEYRETMIANVPLHRDILKAWEEHGGQAV
jgi:tetratricopeptide (TPR) repeat protein